MDLLKICQYLTKYLIPDLATNVCSYLASSTSLDDADFWDRVMNDLLNRNIRTLVDNAVTPIQQRQIKAKFINKLLKDRTYFINYIRFDRYDLLSRGYNIISELSKEGIYTLTSSNLSKYVNKSNLLNDISHFPPLLKEAVIENIDLVYPKYLELRVESIQKLIDKD